MFRWLRERRQRKQKESAERRAQLRRKAQVSGPAGARQQLSYYASVSPDETSRMPDGVAENFAAQLVAIEMAKDADSTDSGRHVAQSHHGSSDNTGGSLSHSHHGHSSHDHGSSHSSHDYGSSHSSSYDSGSYDSGSSSSGSDSSW